MPVAGGDDFSSAVDCLSNLFRYGIYTNAAPPVKTGVL
jgi:hypothetical protein